MFSEEHHTLIYDGSFEGCLCCIFQVYERKLKLVTIRRQSSNLEQGSCQSSMFSSNLSIPSDAQQAKRVWRALKNKLSAKEASRLYKAFLSELPDVEAVILKYVQHALNSNRNINGDYANKYVLKISQIAKMVGRESHRMEAFIRFRLTKEGIYFANVEPDFDVLPLISEHFEKRYADQKWMIYDLKRHYGIYYDLNKVDTIEIALDKQLSTSGTSSLFFDQSEEGFENLWKDYFHHTNIPSRKNTKLHLRHVPKRYWKYLTEKQL